jgi:hypothetical protein
LTPAMALGRTRWPGRGSPACRPSSRCGWLDRACGWTATSQRSWAPPFIEASPRARSTATPGRRCGAPGCRPSPRRGILVILQRLRAAALIGVLVLNRGSLSFSCCRARSIIAALLGTALHRGRTAPPFVRNRCGRGALQGRNPSSRRVLQSLGQGRGVLGRHPSSGTVTCSEPTRCPLHRDAD